MSGFDTPLQPTVGDPATLNNDPPPLPPLRTSVLKDKPIPPTSEIVFHGSGAFLGSEFHELQAAQDYHEERYHRQPISGRQRTIQALNCADEHGLTNSNENSTYKTRVCFDTFDNEQATDISFTLVCKHKDYRYSRRSRTFLCGNDENDYSEFALEWLVDDLVEDGDEIVCLRVVDEDSSINSKDSVDRESYKKEAQELLQKIQEKNANGKSISLVLELAVGKVEDMIQRMIKIYSPVSLIVGTRGRGGIQGLLPGSVSRYCLQNSPVPVIVVRPEDKRRKKREKRSAQSASSVYTSLLDQSATSGQEPSPFIWLPDAVFGLGGQATGVESSAVASAIGVRPDWDGEQTTERQRSTVEVGVDEAMDGLLDQSFEAAAAAGNLETPSPMGPLMMDVVDYDVPEVDLGSPALGPVGGDEIVQKGEGQSQTQMVSDEDEVERIKALSLTEYNEALFEKSKGKAKEEPDAETDLEGRMALNLAQFQAADAAHLGREPKAEDDLEKIKAENLATIQAANKGKGKENESQL
ncbi:hypothetical protein P7C71_g370, partial [Lecanoromycetidae sp. Uapishka_2]